MNILCALARGPLEAKLGNVRATTSFVWTESRAPNFCFKGSGDRVAAYHDSRNARLIQWRAPASVHRAAIIKHRRGNLGPKVEPALLAVVGVVIALSRAK